MTRYIRIWDGQRRAAFDGWLEYDNGDGTFSRVGVAEAADATARTDPNKLVPASALPDPSAPADGSITTAKLADLAVTTAKLENDAVTNDKLRESAGVSVIGRSANSTGNPADIAASADRHFLSRQSGALGFAAIDALDMPAGSVVQVVSTTVAAATFSTNSATFTAITGMSASITPKKNTNRVLVIFSVHMASVASCSVRIMRDSTPLAIGDAGGASQPRATSQVTVPVNYTVSESNMNYLDSPATTSAVVYSLEVESDGANTVYLNKSYGDADNDIYKRVASTITLLEIAA